MRVIPSTLLFLSGGFVAAQDAAAPALISATSSTGADAPAVPTQISFDPDAAEEQPIPELFGDADFLGGGEDLFGDLGGLLSGMFGGDSTTGDANDMMFGGLSDMLSGMFGGGDADAFDGQGMLEAMMGASFSDTGSVFDLECPSSCQNTDLCKVDIMSLMMGGTDTIQEMCDTGCIPTIVLDACNTNADAATAASGGTAEFIAGTGVCDFVNCCVSEEQQGTDAADEVASPTRTKFDECQAQLPEMTDLLASTSFPQDSANAASDFGMPFDIGFGTSDFQDMIEEIVDGFEEVLDQFGGGMLSDMFADMFQSSAIPAFCAVDTCNNAPPGFCECFSGDLAKCNTEVISQACTTDTFSTCAPEGFSEFCSNECGAANGADILHMCAMCNVVTCCSKDNSEVEACLSEALEVDHSQAFMDDADAIFTELEDFLGGMDLEGILTEVLGDMESMKWCPDDKTCPEPLGQQFCDMVNGGPSVSDTDIAVSPRIIPGVDLQTSFDLGNIGMDLDAMCSSDMLFSCGPVDMKTKCDDVCGTDDNNGFMKEAFCQLCGLASCCESGDKTFSECIPSGSSTALASEESNQDSISQTPNEESSVVANPASEEEVGPDFTETTTEEVSEEAVEGELDPVQITALENSRFEQENSGMSFSSVTFFTAIVSTGLVLALY